MRTWMLFFGSALAALLFVAALSQLLPEEFTYITAILTGLIVFSGSVGARAVRTHLERVNRSAASDSVETELGLRARSDTFGYLLIALPALGLALLLMQQIVAATAILGLLVVGLALFWARYGMLRHEMIIE